ncbi:MAG: N-acetylmuramoyl-L-alanine amidase [Bacillota bacterium]|nr:N-acetylmuramoyl-L-alanine amidase [Bacillota bacterium]
MNVKTLVMIPILMAFMIIAIHASLNDERLVTAVSEKKLTVVIDAGHGGIDPGAVIGSFLEKEINLAVAKNIKTALEAKGFQVIMTRDSDSNLLEVSNNKIINKQLNSLANRLSISEKVQPDVLVSIHVNSSDSAAHFGPQCFYKEGAIKGKELAELIQQKLTNVRMGKRIAIPGDYYMLNNSSVPAVIVELGFITNKEERQLLEQESYRKLLADAISAAIIEFLHQDS